MSKRDHATPTLEIFAKMEAATNPVTRASYRSILANRLGIADAYELRLSEEHSKAHRFMRTLTYSFESRKKMEKFFNGK